MIADDLSVAVGYRAPETLNEAVALLAADPGAKVLTGGPSLMPALAFRLAPPTLLVVCPQAGW